MGQYHAIYNKTKKESFSIGGAKLWEQAHDATAAALLMLLSNSNGRGGGDFYIYTDKYDKKTHEPIYSAKQKAQQAAINLVSGRWAGDEIVVQGDYAKKTDAAFISNDEFRGYRPIQDLVLAALLAADERDNSRVTKIVNGELEWKQKLKTIRAGGVK